MKDYVKNNKRNYYILIFIFIFVICRVYFLNFEFIDTNNYIQKFNLNDFFNKLYYHQSTNIGYFFLTAIYKIVFGNLYTVKTAVIINSVYSLISIYLLSITIKKINITVLVLLSFYSILLIPYEMWRPAHWDHINLLIISFLIFSIFKFLENNNNYPLLLLSNIFLVLFNSIGFIIYFFFLFYILFFKKIKIKIKILFLIPLILILSVMFKNFSISNNFAPTSMGGANLIQRSIHAIGIDNYHQMIKLNKKDYPKWWLKIHNNIKSQKYKNIDDFISSHAHGLSNGSKERRDYFENLVEILNEDIQKNKKLKIISDLEKKIINENFFSDIGYNINNIGNFYMSYGKKVFVQSCINYPWEMFIGNIGSKGFLLTGLQMISHGSIFPKYYENKKIPWSRELIILYNIIKFIIFLFLFSSVIFFSKALLTKNFDFEKKFYFINFSLIFLFTSITSILTCCENPRLMVMYSPMVIYLAYFGLEYIIKIKKV